MGSSHLLLTTQTPLGRAKIFANAWEPLDGPQWSMNQPTQKTCAPTAPPLSSAPVPGACLFPFPYSTLSLFLPPCNPPGRPPALGKVQGLGPSVPVAVWAAGAELCPLQEGRAVSASCLLSSVEAAGHRWSLSVRSVISFGALKTALNEDVAA